jgi:FHA domain
MLGHPAPLVPSSSATSGEHAHATPLRTATIDESQCEPWYDGEDAIEALGEYDTPREHELSVITKSFDLGGSSRCAVSVPGCGLSKRHCLLERRGMRFLVHDLDSKNGTIHDGRRIREAIDLNPGDRFTAVPITFVALNRAMRVHRPLLIDLLGTAFAPSADKLMIEAAKGLGNLLITGEAGCEQGRLAHAIHAMSLVHDRPLVECAALPVDRASQVALVTAASRSTLVLTLTEKTRAVDSTFHSMLFSRNYRIRVIVIAPGEVIARRVLSRDEVGRMQHVWIRPIAVRVGELPMLLDRLLAERDAPIRHGSLTRASWEGFLATRGAGTGKSCVMPPIVLLRSLGSRTMNN